MIPVVGYNISETVLLPILFSVLFLNFILQHHTLCLLHFTILWPICLFSPPSMTSFIIICLKTTNYITFVVSAGIEYFFIFKFFWSSFEFQMVWNRRLGQMTTDLRNEGVWLWAFMREKMKDLVSSYLSLCLAPAPIFHCSLFSLFFGFHLFVIIFFFTLA